MLSRQHSPASKALVPACLPTAPSTSHASIGTPVPLTPTRTRLPRASLPRHLPGPAALLHPPDATRVEGVAVCIRYYEANRDKMRYDLYRARGLQVGSGVVKAPASASSGTGSNNRGAAGRKRAPTPCSPSNTASKTTTGPKSSIGGIAAPRLPDQKTWDAPQFAAQIAFEARILPDSFGASFNESPRAIRRAMRNRQSPAASETRAAHRHRLRHPY